MRFVPHRHKVKDHSKPGVSDNVIFSGRDGKHWFRPFLESWLKPGLDQKNWTQRSLIVAQGILKTGDEFSLFVNEHYYHDTARIRRVTVPLFRFASVYADRFGGTFLTKPFVLEGSRLVLNYATSAPGLVKVGLQDEEKRFFEGFSCSDCDEIYGDELEKTVTWNGSEDIGKLKGKVVRLFFELADADVYAFQIRP